MKKIIVVLFLVAAVLGLFVFRHNIKTGAEKIISNYSLPKTTVSYPRILSESDELAQNNDVSVTKIPRQEEKPPALPLEFNLAVPFTSQAPFSDWSMPYKEGCEEASVIMINAFYQNKTLNQTGVKKEINKMVVWQMENFKEHRDLNASDMVKFIQGYYGYQNAEIINNPTLEEIKKEILAGHPLIVPTAGQLLNNPYFRQPGPVYHMLVLRGWTKNGMLIANDPGTKRGENYLYAPETIFNALHDWNQENVLNGDKVLIKINK